MEIKDLILLVLIPIMLVSIIFYTDSNKSITGFVTTQQEDNNILGAYSILPSFKAKIDYNLEEEYKSIKNDLEQLIENCKSEPNMGQCFKDESNRLNWNCEESRDKAQDILYDFTDKLKECIALEEDGIVCRFSLDERETEKLKGDFSIILTNENQKTRVDLKYGGSAWADYIEFENLIYTDYDGRNSPGKNLNSVKITAEYSNKKPEIKEILGTGENSEVIPLSKALFFYKKDDSVKFIDRSIENLFRSQSEIRIIDLPKTSGMKFCAKSKEPKNKNIVYKFAVVFPELVIPPPVKELKAEDKLKAEKSVVLRWNKVKWDDETEFSDFEHYNVYCSKGPLEDKDTKEIKLDNLKPTMAVKSINKDNNNYDVWYADLNKCGKDAIEDGIQYFFAVTSLAKSGMESKAVKQVSVKPIDDLAPGQQNIVLINSDGKKEEKMSSACIELPKTSESGTPGNIRVGFYAPKKNEDEITDLEPGDLLTYNLHFSTQAPATADLDMCNERLRCVQLSYAPKENTADIYELDLRRFNKFREIGHPNNMFEEGQTYCFTIVAKDKAGNVISTLTTPYKFEKPRQWTDLENNPVIKGFFDADGKIKWEG